MRKCFAAALLALLLGACAQQVPQQAPTLAVPAVFPEAYYKQVAAQGRPVFRVDASGSLVVVEVRRSGSLAHLGHDHVVASHDVGGYVAPGEGRADLFVPLGQLVVDESALRKEAGFETQPTESDIAGTRSNMLEKVLEADRFPLALIAVHRDGAGSASVTIVLHGVARTLEVPVQMEESADSIEVAGKFSIDQTDFGITPYSILGGAIAVRNRLDLRFRIRAARL
jgi:YceI-like domain